MGKIFRSIYTFYLSHFFVGIILSLCCAELFKTYGFAILTTICWFKAATMGIIFYTINHYKQKEFYYYRNLHISVRFLWGITLGFDFLVYIILLILIYYQR